MEIGSEIWSESEIKSMRATSMRFYYKTHQERYKHQYICECGGKYQISYKSKHMKTIKHQEYCNSLI